MSDRTQFQVRCRDGYLASFDNYQEAREYAKHITTVVGWTVTEDDVTITKHRLITEEMPI